MTTLAVMGASYQMFISSGLSRYQGSRTYFAGSAGCGFTVTSGWNVWKALRVDTLKD